MSNNWGLLTEELEKKKHAFVEIPGRGTLVIRRIRGNDVEHFQRLEGLAVPRLAPLSAQERKELVGDYEGPILATHYAGRWFGYYKFTPGQLIGAWCFLVEQFAAIRRRGFLYTDIKFTNVVCQPGVRDVRIIDLEGCLPLSSDGTYPVEKVPYSLKYTAPEHVDILRQEREGMPVPESAVVYQLGVMPVCALAALRRLNIRTPVEECWTLFEGELRKRYARFYALCQECASPRAQERPGTFEAVLERIHEELGGPEYRRARGIWERLRAPYGAALASMGFRASGG